MQPTDPSDLPDLVDSTPHSPTHRHIHPHRQPTSVDCQKLSGQSSCRSNPGRVLVGLISIASDLSDTKLYLRGGNSISNPVLPPFNNLSPVLPFPNCPASLDPVAYTCPVLVRNNENVWPAETETIRVSRSFIQGPVILVKAGTSARGA